MTNWPLPGEGPDSPEPEAHVKTLPRTAWTLLLTLTVVPLTAVAGQEPATYPELDRMHEEAMAVAVSSTSFRADLKEAVKRHESVVDARALDDVRRFQCLSDHAALLHGIGELAESRRYMEAAAEHAQATGDVFNAAMTWLNVAIVAQQLGEDGGDLIQRAQLLTHSSLLTPEQRWTVLERIAKKRARTTTNVVR